MVFLILPAAGFAYTAGRVGRRTLAGAVNWSSGRPERQAVLGAIGAAAVAIAAFSWWPNGEYRPIQPAERGTFAGLLHQIEALPSGRPSLTAERQRQLGGAPSELQRSHRPTHRGTTPVGRRPGPSKSERTSTNSSTTTTGSTTLQTATTPQPYTGTTTAPAGTTTTPTTATTTPPTTPTTPTTTPTTNNTPTDHPPPP